MLALRPFCLRLLTSLTTTTTTALPLQGRHWWHLASFSAYKLYKPEFGNSAHAPHCKAQCQKIFKTLRLGHRWADVDDTWHVYSTGYSGDTTSRKQNLNFGACTLRHRPQLTPAARCQDFQIIQLQHCWVDVDDTWHVYSMGLGTQFLWSRILNFGACAARHHPQIPSAQCQESFKTLQLRHRITIIKRLTLR